MSCKLNRANIDTNKDGIISVEEDKSTKQSGVQCQHSSDINSSIQKQCSGCKTSPWWKFWAKKNTNCPCSQAQINKDADLTKEKEKTL